MEKQNRIRAFLYQSHKKDAHDTAFELLHSELPPLQNPWFIPRQDSMESAFAKYDDFGVGLPPLAGN